MRFKSEIYIYKNGSTVALTKAHSKEEAMFKFEKVFADVSGDMIKKAEFDYSDIARVNIE
jgi:hypothetical protein